MLSMGTGIRTQTKALEGPDAVHYIIPTGETPMIVHQPHIDYLILLPTIRCPIVLLFDQIALGCFTRFGKLLNLLYDKI